MGTLIQALHLKHASQSLTIEIARNLPALSQSNKCRGSKQITLLYNETAARVDLDMIDKPCRLFDVTVGELFEVVPGATKTKRGRRS
jgi:DNA-binding Xre family transcriptional regulator